MKRGVGVGVGVGAGAGAGVGVGVSGFDGVGGSGRHRRQRRQRRRGLSRPHPRAAPRRLRRALSDERPEGCNSRYSLILVPCELTSAACER